MDEKGFFAYPSQQISVVDAARAVVSNHKARGLQLDIKGWEELDIAGRFISSEVLNQIERSGFLLADVTTLNFNVTYEVGYAIGKGKRVIALRNKSVLPITPTVQEVGIFDTLAYKEYSTSDDILDFLKGLTNFVPLSIDETIAQKPTVYIVQPKIKTDYDVHIASGIKNAHLFFKSFDPTESPRLSAPDAIKNVSQTSGTVLHLLPDSHVDSKVHNIRCAFVAGLADGMGKRSLYIQTGETPVPIDLRDFVTHCRHPDDFGRAISSLAERIYDDKDVSPRRKQGGKKSNLLMMDLGASAAENEFTVLGDYYLETDAYRRAKRKEVRLITGRKGSGKTAIFFMLRNEVRAKRQNVVLDLKPEGYQLLKLKDSVIDWMAIGTVEHTFTAFWESLLWLEICHKILESDQELHTRDPRLLEPYQRLQQEYAVDDDSREGDFAERLKTLLRDIVSVIDSKYSGKKELELTTRQITELVYKHNFPKLRERILTYLSFKGELWLLFDNIDKGWSPQGVADTDLVIVRSLMEATRKIERDLHRASISAQTIVFLRNDVYERLVETTSDRGKETRAHVDWDDPDQLIEMLRLRIVRSFSVKHNTSFSDIWPTVCTPSINGQDSIKYLMDRCLMRPRSLIELVGHCRGYALNLGRERISRDDILKGCAAFSNDLLSELDLEVRDVFPEVEHLLYAFIGANSQLSRHGLENILSSHGVSGERFPTVIEILLWFGFIGFIWTDGKPRYIYSFNYNMKVLEGIHSKLLGSDVTYILNPAFAPALGFSTIGEQPSLKF